MKHPNLCCPHCFISLLSTRWDNQIDLDRHAILCSFSPSLLSMFEITSYFETNIPINKNVDINNLLVRLLHYLWKKMTIITKTHWNSSVVIQLSLTYSRIFFLNIHLIHVCIEEKERSQGNWPNCKSLCCCLRGVTYSVKQVYNLSYTFWLWPQWQFNLIWC